MSEAEILKKLETQVGLELDAALQQLLDLTRRSATQDWSTVIGEKGIAIIGRSAFGAPSASPTTRHLALRCLNNILYLSKPTRQLFVDSGFTTKSIGLMRSNVPDDESLSTRLMLLCSVDTRLDLTACIEQHDLAGVINTNISRHARDASQQSVEPALNLLSTLGANPKYESQMYRLSDSLTPILEMLERAPMASPPLGSPVSLLISSLLAIPFVDKLPDSITDKLVDILDQALPTNLNGGGNIDHTISPLMGLLLRIADQSETRPRLRARLIVSDDDHAVVLGRGDSLPHRLIRLSAEITAPTLKQLTSFLLFKLSDEDSKQLIANVGYGYGVGLLQSMNKPFSPSDLETRQTGTAASDTNPITGQRLDAEADSRSDLPAMTQEEKEREAERLFVLFERLKATGVVDVENPVAQAHRSGHVEELDENSGDETNG